MPLTAILYASLLIIRLTSELNINTFQVKKGFCNRRGKGEFLIIYYANILSDLVPEGFRNYTCTYAIYDIQIISVQITLNL